MKRGHFTFIELIEWLEEKGFLTEAEATNHLITAGIKIPRTELD